MVHLLYEGSVHPDEKCKTQITELWTFRVKTLSGRYYHLLADSKESAEAWVKAHEAKLIPA